MIILDTHVWLWWINQDQTRFKPEWTARMDIATQCQQPGASGVISVSRSQPR